MSDVWTYPDDLGDLVVVLGDDTTEEPMAEAWDATDATGGEWPWDGPL